MMWWLLAASFAQDLTPETVEYVLVRPGRNIAALAESLGHPSAEAEIRALNELDEGEEPRVGTLLALPTFEGLLAQDAVLLSYSGEGTAVLPGGSTYTLADCLRVPSGSVLCTSEDGFATVRLSPDRTGALHDDVTLLPNTCLEVQSSTVRAGRRTSKLYVSQGAVTVQGAEAGGGELVVETPSGLAASTDGDFRVVVEDGAQRTEALTDPVSVMGAGAEVVLGDLQGNRVNTGEAPGPAVDLPAMSTLTAPEPQGVLYRPDFLWSQVDGALFYTVELSVDEGFTEMVRREHLETDRWRPTSLMVTYRADGLWWRVSAVDELGFEGPPSRVREVRFPPGVGP